MKVISYFTSEEKTRGYHLEVQAVAMAKTKGELGDVPTEMVVEIHAMNQKPTFFVIKNRKMAGEIIECMRHQMNLTWPEAKAQNLN